MLQRANHLVARARERIRIASEHDPHDDWHTDGHGGHVVHRGHPEDVDPDDLEDADGADDRPLAAVAGAPTGSTAADPGTGAAPLPLGSPEVGTPDLDGPVGPGGVSGPPDRSQ